MARKGAPKGLLVILAGLGMLVALGLFITVPLIYGVDGLLSAILLALGVALPSVWWIHHELREYRAANDPNAPAAVMDRRWRYIIPVAVVLTFLGGLTLAMSEPLRSDNNDNEETSSATMSPPPSPSRDTSTRTTPTGTVTTPSSSTTTSSPTSTSETTTSDTTTTTTTPTSEPTSEPTSDPTTPTEEPTSDPTTPTEEPTTDPPTTTSVEETTSEPVPE